MSRMKGNDMKPRKHLWSIAFAIIAALLGALAFTTIQAGAGVCD
jgi:hypothetical protein